MAAAAAGFPGAGVVVEQDEVLVVRLVFELAAAGAGGLRPNVASALDNDSLLKLRSPLRLFGNGGNPSILRSKP